MTLSVCMITYNHEKYIAEAIEGILMQLVEFPFELVIANDTSTDSTNEIINDFIINHPKGNLIRYFNHSENFGMMSNFIFGLNNCKGKYIALCEGDDYWSDPFKLQKQVDFLEANIDYSLCFHETISLRHNGVENLMIKANEDKSFHLADLLQRNFIPTVSSVFRSLNVVNNLDSKFAQLSAGDWALHLLSAERGKIYYFKDCMAVYRIHSTGVWSSMDRDTMVKKTICLMDELNRYFDNKYHNDFEKGKQLLCEEYSREVLLHTSPKLSLVRRVKRKIKRIFSAV